jgi:proline iminopeptidase
MRRMGLIALLLSVSVTPAIAAAPRAEFVRAPGATLWVESRGQGSGPPLVVVNGGPGVEHGYLMVSDAWDRLARGRRVVFYDQRGVGRSPRLAKSQSCNLADQIADLDAVRAHLGADRIDVLGHSWGGYLSMAYAARHPEHVRRLIVCDSAAPKWEDTVFLFKDIFPETVARQSDVAFAEALGDTAAIATDFRAYLTMLCYSPEHREAMRKAPPPAFDNAINARLNEDLKRYDLNPELPKYKFPTLVMCGRFDINVAPIVAWKIHQAIPGSAFHVFEQSGHLPFYEQPDEFVQVVERFLAGSGS